MRRTGRRNKKENWRPCRINSLSSWRLISDIWLHLNRMNLNDWSSRTTNSLRILLTVWFDQLGGVHIRLYSTSSWQYISGDQFSNASWPIILNASSTPLLFLALTYMCLNVGCLARNSLTAISSTDLLSAQSLLFPSNRKGKVSMFCGCPWSMKPSNHDSTFSKD